MFGFSLAELIVVFLVALLFIRPKDLPEIARFFGKTYYRFKNLVSDIKKYLKEAESELGLGDLKKEMDQAIAEEKSKLDDNLTVIVDIHGNKHKVNNLSEIRPDLTKEEIEQEVNKLNEENSNENLSNSDQK